ncbi:PAAR-like domain-containing protein [Rhizobium sp. SG741]|uniref:PAAR-like domain-containing protein n=1 Tax=Rhizobium sp. SG741 TaxID=2587114 RepID=UPI001446EA05|nr:PAAR-like domain-containing protein [Rhizobium sp. SG741]NKJ09419.1 hypothetical protein [Rhizobium sp. SG741]
MGERQFPDSIYDGDFAALYGLPPDTKIIGPPMSGTLLTKTPDGSSPMLKYDGPWPPPKKEAAKPVEQTRPTAAVPPPPELIPDDSSAIAVCLSPDVCKSPTAPVPYMVWGKADDKQNYSPDVRSNGDVIKRSDSRFTATYGDQPGTGLGVKSGTVGNVVTPVTSSNIVRANGVPVQRHTDRCTLNNGNCPGEYVNVKSTAMDMPPDGNDAQDRSWWDAAKDTGGDFWKGMTATSGTASTGEGIFNKVGEWWNDPSQIGRDAQSAYDSIPTGSEIWQGTKNIAGGAAHVAGEVWNDPVGSAKATGGWAKDQAVGAWHGVEAGYEKHGVAGAVGAVAGIAVEIVNPLKKLKMLERAAEVAEELGDLKKAEKLRKEAGEIREKEKQAERALEAREEGKDGARSTRAIPEKNVECFKKPAHLSDEEFDKQLQEQMDALRNIDADTLLQRRKAIRDAGGTSPLRDLNAQTQARRDYESGRLEELAQDGIVGQKAADKVAEEMSDLAATHRLDIIAGGDPSDISGLGDKGVNSSLGSQWKGRRSQSLEDYASEMKKNGLGKEKLKVNLKKC